LNTIINGDTLEACLKAKQEIAQITALQECSESSMQKGLSELRLA